jgi:hypothetical protein
MFKRRNATEENVKFHYTFSGLGTMSGAVESGLRVAIEVMDEIRPQCLSAQDYAVIKDSAKFGRKRNRNRKPHLAETSFNVLKWTLVLPIVGIAVGCFAYRSVSLLSEF